MSLFRPSATIWQCDADSWPEQEILPEALCLWQEVALVTFQTGFNEVSDVQWWPGNATTFALVDSRGSVEVC